MTQQQESALVTIGMNYDVLPGKEAAFEHACSAVIKAMEGMTDHLRTQLFRNVHASSSYLIVSDWSKQAAFEAFIQSETFANVTNWGKEHILAGRPKHTVYTSQA